jgi:general secretion pathway protein D
MNFMTTNFSKKFIKPFLKPGASPDGDGSTSSPRARQLDGARPEPVEGCEYQKRSIKIVTIIILVLSNPIVLYCQNQAPMIPNVSFSQMPAMTESASQASVPASVPTGQALPEQVVQKNDAGIPTVLPQTASPVTEQPAQNSQAMPSNVSVASQNQPITPDVSAAVPKTPATVSVNESIIGGEILKPKNDADIVDSGQDADIYLNFDNASLGSIVNYIGEQKKINVVPHKDLAAANVTMSTRKGLTLNRAWNVVLTLLEMNGFSMVKVGNVYRVVSNKENRYEPLPVYSSGTGTEPEDLPQSDMVVRYIYLFKNIKAELAKDILGSMLDKEGILISSDLNACIIKEKCFNIKAAMKIVKQLDMGGLSEQIKIIQLKNANADTVAALFQEITGAAAGTDSRVIRFADKDSKKERAYFSSATKIFSEPIQNRLILLGTQNNLNKITDFIYKYIDVPIGGAESRLHIKEIRYAKAEDLKPILDEIIKAPKGQGSDKSVLVGEFKFFEDVVIAAEKATGTDDTSSTRGGGNRLVISCNRDEWKRLEQLIAKLDKPQPQVALEVMIINVDSDQAKQLGSQMYQLFGHRPGMGLYEFEARNLSSAVVKKEGVNVEAPNYIQLAQSDYEGNGHPTFVTLGKAATQTSDYENIWSIIKAVISSTNSNVIAQPFLVSNNNQPCRVEVATTYRMDGELDSRKGENSKLKKVDVNASTIVEITPKMNLVGTVDLDIKVTADEFIDTDPTVGSKTNRLLKTKASMLAGEVLVLGGLTKHKDVESTWKTPILGDIPIIGSIFFKNKQKTQKQETLYIFIRPSIIKPRFEGAADEYTQLKLDYAKYQLLKNDTFLKDKDPIQRWFFRPPDQSIKQKLTDVSNGVIRPLDDFVFAKSMPRMVNIKADSYYKVSEELAKYEEKIKHKRQKEQPEEIVTGTVTLN